MQITWSMMCIDNNLGCVCFGWKWFQEIIFPLTRVFGSYGKFYFPENHFLWPEIYSFDPEMILHFHFHFNSFLDHVQKREKARERRELSQPLTPIQFTLGHTELSQSSLPLTVVQSLSQTQTHGEWELSHKLTPILTNAPDPAHSGSCRAQPVDHRSSQSDHWAKHRLTVSFPSSIDRFTPPIHTQVQSTSPPTQICQNPQPILPDPILALYIYIYIYIFIYINIYIIIYFFYLLIF